MADRLAEGTAWLTRQRSRHMGRRVSYRRGVIAVEITATFGRTEYAIADAYGGRVGAEMTDFLIAAADLAKNFGRPEPGDRIQADGTVYEVMDLAGQGHWRWSDPYHASMRIHAKEVGQDPVAS